MTYASIDPGSSITKAGSDDKVTQFPSLVVPAEKGQGICVEGAWWLVGEDAIYAQRVLQTDPQKGSEYHGSTVQRVLICEALRRLGLGRGGQELDGIAIGMPYDLACNVDVCDALEQSYKRFVWETRDGRSSVQASRVYIPPQGGGTLCLVMSEMTQPDGEIVSVLDVGGQTADVVTVQLGQEMGQEVVIPAASQSVNVNVYQFYLDLVRQMAQQGYAVSRQHDYHGLMGRLRRKQFVIPGGPGGATQDIAPIVSRVRAGWTATLNQAVRDVIGSRWMDLSTVVITGGGAHLVDPTVWQGPFRTLDDMANVRGQLLALKGSAA